MSIVARLFEEALHLPENDRADLAAKLLESLDPALDENLDEAWAEEIQHRLEDLQQGRVQPVPWTEARKLIVDDHDDDVS